MSFTRLSNPLRSGGFSSAGRGLAATVSGVGSSRRQRHVLLQEPRPVAFQQPQAIADLAVLEFHVGQRDELRQLDQLGRLNARPKICTSSTHTSPAPIRSNRTRSDVSPSSGRSST